MHRSDVENGIHKGWSAVEKLGLNETFSNPALLQVNESFNEVALSVSSSYAAIYNAGLALSYYNFLLSDYSYFQFSWSSKDNVRYAYYPNPYISGDDGWSDFRRRRELVESGMINYEEYLSMLRDAPAHGNIPLIRYENAPGQWKELRHPCSHFHIGRHGENRWAINRVLTPLAFTLLILKQYYSYFWFGLGDNELNEFGNSFEEALICERMNCRVIGDDKFSAVEARSFHFT